MDAQQLKNSILQEAIEGRLVPQDPNDEPASVLLDKIRKEKARLVKEGKLKKKDLEEKPISKDEIPFEIPESWEWVRLSSLSKKITKGTTPRGGNVAYSLTGVGFLRAENIAGLDKLDLSLMKYVTKDEHIGFLSRSILETNDLLITIAGTLGRTALVRECNLPLNANQAVSLVRLVDYKVLSLLYVIYALNAPSVQIILTTQKKVTAIPNLTLEIISDCVIPLPPLAEQHRIVAKIEELLPKVEEYGKAQEALDKLNSELPEKLKKSILQEAITGQLVPQDPNDEPASVLLDKIRKEKARLVKEGKLKKKDLEETPISENEKPFEIPDSWEWVSVGQYTNKVTDYVASGSFATLRDNVSYYKEENYALLVKTKDFQSNFEKDLTFTDEKGYNFLANSNLFGGELILSNVGSIGKIFVVPKLNRKMTLAPNAIMVRLWDEQHRDWLLYLFQSLFGLQSLYSISSATAIRKFNKTDFKKLLIPLPPLAEQHRIVAKIEELFAEIDKLKV